MSTDHDFYCEEKYSSKTEMNDAKTSLSFRGHFVKHNPLSISEDCTFFLDGNAATACFRIIQSITINILSL